MLEEILQKNPHMHSLHTNCTIPCRACTWQEGAEFACKETARKIFSDLNKKIRFNEKGKLVGAVVSFTKDTWNSYWEEILK